jgi:hypothetical protein
VIVLLYVAWALVTAALVLFFGIGAGSAWIAAQLARVQQIFSAIIERRRG